jgi:hypothetical protein
MDFGHVSHARSLPNSWIELNICSVSGVYFISVLLFLTETRSDIILARLACKIRKEKHDDRYRVRAENNKPSLLTLIKMSSVRPIGMWFDTVIRRLPGVLIETAEALLTEPIVLSFSVGTSHHP